MKWFKLSPAPETKLEWIVIVVLILFAIGAGVYIGWRG
jgi:hypothetical protein